MTISLIIFCHPPQNSPTIGTDSDDLTGKSEVLPFNNAQPVKKRKLVFDLFSIYKIYTPSISK
jgi:hypothetical protein